MHRVAAVGSGTAFRRCPQSVADGIWPSYNEDSWLRLCVQLRGSHRSSFSLLVHFFSVGPGPRCIYILHSRTGLNVNNIEFCERCKHSKESTVRCKSKIIGPQRTTNKPPDKFNSFRQFTDFSANSFFLYLFTLLLYICISISYFRRFFFSCSFRRVCSIRSDTRTKYFMAERST